MSGSERLADATDHRGAEVRGVAARVVANALEARLPVGPLLHKERAGFSPRDQRLLHELVLGTLRWLRFVDFVIETAADRPLSKIDADLLPTLRVAVYQLLYLDRVPSHAVVDAAVEEIKRRSHRGAAGFANAILRRVSKRRDPTGWPLRKHIDAGNPLEVLALETSYPPALVHRWADRFGRRGLAAMLSAGNRRAGYQLTSLIDRHELAARLESEGVETRPAALSPVGLEVIAGDPRATEAFRSGAFYIQDQASQAAALIPAPRRGERILDVAAAPGGKCFAILAAEPNVRLVAADVSLLRMRRLRANQRRLGLEFGVAVATAERPSFRNGFDRVVLDLPCTGTGTFSRHPELKWRISKPELVRLAAEGLAMLRSSADLVAPGGRLCAITCSLEREENEDVVAAFLERDPSFELEALELGADLAPFVVGPGLWRVLPSESHDGFTVHVLRRR